MAWKIEYSRTARKQLWELDLQKARNVLAFGDDLAKQENPRDMGKALSGPMGTLWSYRLGGIRLICDLQDDLARIQVLRLGEFKEGDNG
ncbi:type II toxin-antitoxin system RelE family toxin [Desulfobacca acetoxidans]|uniref:Toxin-like protein n=1 Tax=Desulfobacca acetoxidans (strain ATCC 700848 / DSM 11109 / ASRB2) TaxID=880072 RepID=F2NJ03_DESAR|nr:type II toxin-antitoxin system RelE/ParE family toxin [Desulfobacca acetoxidans]AEB07961.1 toxin-like protein [Desulfobacca acetoxidans DSM 11109]